MKEQWKVILLIITLIFVVVFALQNTSNVTIDLLVTRFQVPLVLVILFSLLLGVIIGLVSSMVAIQANRKDNKKLQKEIDSLKSDYQGQINEKNDKIRQLHEDLESQKNVSTYNIPSQTVSTPEPVEDIHDSLESEDYQTAFDGSTHVEENLQGEDHILSEDKETTDRI